MRKRKTWRSKLTKAELRHITDDAGCRTLYQLKRNFEGQAQMRIDNPEIEPCWECKFIAEKLGFAI